MGWPVFLEPMRMFVTPVALAAMMFGLGGCATSYVPPGAKADLQAFAPPSIQEGFAAKPPRACKLTSFFSTPSTPPFSIGMRQSHSP